MTRTRGLLAGVALVLALLGCNTEDPGGECTPVGDGATLDPDC